MTAKPPENIRFENSDVVEVRVNGNVVGRLEERTESALPAEAAVALEVDQLVESMNQLLADLHDIQSDGDESISAEIVAYREPTVEVYTSDHGEWRSVTDHDRKGVSTAGGRTETGAQETGPNGGTDASDREKPRVTDEPPESTRFEEAKYIEIKAGGEIVARVEHRPATSTTDSETGGLSLILESIVDDIEERLQDEYGRTPYEVLTETGTTVEVNAAGIDEWVTRVE